MIRQMRSPSQQLARAITALAITAAVTALAAVPETNAIPKLLPPYGEIPPSYWEQHGAATAVAGVVALSVLAFGLWLVLRPKPVPPVPPDVQARTALGELRRQPEDGAQVSAVSQILRRYILAAFELPAGEVTTTEFCQMIERNDRMGTTLASTLATFLHECDARKFSLAAPGSPLDAAARALEFVTQAEQRLAQLRQPAGSRTTCS